MIFRQNHLLQIRDLDPKALSRDLRYLNLDASAVCKQADQHLPLSGQLFDKHQLIFERAQSY